MLRLFSAFPRLLRSFERSPSPIDEETSERVSGNHERPKFAVRRLISPAGLRALIPAAAVARGRAAIEGANSISAGINDEPRILSIELAASVSFGFISRSVGQLRAEGRTRRFTAADWPQMFRSFVIAGRWVCGRERSPLRFHRLLFFLPPNEEKEFQFVPKRRTIEGANYSFRWCFAAFRQQLGSFLWSTTTLDFCRC